MLIGLIVHSSPKPSNPPPTPPRQARHTHASSPFFCRNYLCISTFSKDGEGGEKGEGGDTPTAAATAGGDTLSIVEGEEIGGVVFSAVAARRPELKRELGILRQALLLEEQSGGGGGGEGGSEELKVCVRAHLSCFFLSPAETRERKKTLSTLLAS